jgi:hypothetical protein
MAKGIILRNILNIVSKLSSLFSSIKNTMILQGTILTTVASIYFLKDILVNPKAYDEKSLM